MPRVKIARDNCTDSSKDVTTRSKANKIKSEVKVSSSPVLKKRKISKPVPQTKSIVSKRQPKKEVIDEDEHNGNLRQNKSNTNSAKNSIRVDKFNDNNQKNEQKSNQNKKIIIIDDNSKDSNDDNDYESEDDYEPDTDDEEEYRSRSHFW